MHLLHGWAEHALRYERFAASATAAGIAVYADDHRGHGRTGQAAGGLGDLGPRGADGVLDAVRAVSEVAFGEHPGRPRLLLGHSWGSFLGQRYLRRWGGELEGAILTGTTLRHPGAARTSPLNEPFEPAATPYDWLSRDAVEVQRYIDDPLCGFEMMSVGMSKAPPPSATPSTPPPVSTGPDNSTVPAGLPLLILNGGDDPIGGQVGGQALADHYREAGLLDVTFRSYPGGRHELLNETNRDEVTTDLLDWMVARSG